MGSFFAYTQPRGIRGNFKAVLLFELGETEREKVYPPLHLLPYGYTYLDPSAIVTHRKFPLEKIAPVNRDYSANEWVIYRYRQIVVGDIFKIIIEDYDIAHRQDTRITATMDGFTLTNHPSPIPDIGTVVFNKIELINFDKMRHDLVPKYYDLLQYLFDFTRSI